MNLELVEKLQKLRKDNNLSQEQLAEKIGVSRQAISKWERGEATPDSDNLICLAKIYNISLDELISSKENNNMNEESKKTKSSTKKSNKHKPDINELDDEPTDTNTKVKNSTKSSKNSRPKNSSKNNNDSTTNQSIDPYYEE